MSNSIDQPYINNVELHRPTVYQQCRTPSTNRMSTMSNSIDQPYISNVELHRQSHCMSQFERRSTWSTTPIQTNHDDIDYSSTSVTSDNRPRVRCLHRRVESANSPTPVNRQPSTVNRQPSTINRQHRCRTVKIVNYKSRTLLLSIAEL